MPDTGATILCFWLDLKLSWKTWAVKQKSESHRSFRNASAKFQDLNNFYIIMIWILAKYPQIIPKLH